MHVYTSPHLVRFNERFRLGAPAAGSSSDEELRVALEECERVNAGAPITVFEITTAAAMLLFARHPADVLVLEVGLGGRLDATNVIDRAARDSASRASRSTTPIFSATRSRRSPAKKPASSSAACRRSSPRSIATRSGVIERQARARACAAAHRRRGFHAAEERGRLVYQDEAGLLDLPPPRLSGRHQYRQCRAGDRDAARAIDDSRFPPAAFEAGMTRADWPARMQRLAQGRLVEHVAGGRELWLDGGHNPDGGRAIAAALADLEERVSRPLVLIAGMLASKDSEGFLRNFNGLARRLIAVPVPGSEKSVPRGRSRRTRARHRAFRDQPRYACGCARSGAQARARTAAANSDTGSLYLAGEALRENGTLPS